MAGRRPADAPALSAKQPGIRLFAGDPERLRTLAENTGIDAAELHRQAVSRYLDEHKEWVES